MGKGNDEAITAPDSQERLEDAELLKQALTELPRKYRECLLLQVVGELPQQEIASLVGISKGSVSVYINKARKQLRETLQRFGVELSRQEKGGRTIE